MPGVPPDAANIVKRVFKGIFKRGNKKSKQDNAAAAAAGANPSTSTAPASQQQGASAPADAASSSPVPAVDAKPPQLPPIANASPLQSATASTKSVPPTHPLSTGEHGTAQEAVPQKKDAEPAPGPPLGAAAGTAATPEPAPNASTAGGLKEPEKLGASNADVSPPVSAMENADAPESGAVSTISNEQTKLDGAADSVTAEPAKVEEPKVAEPATQSADPADTTTATTPATGAAPAATKENGAPQTNGTTTASASASSPADATATQTTTDTATAAVDAKAAPSDEKMPATMEEPPPIKAVRTAPGMSATSGPLEDFPEGGDAKD